RLPRHRDPVILFVTDRVSEETRGSHSHNAVRLAVEFERLADDIRVLGKLPPPKVKANDHHGTCTLDIVFGSKRASAGGLHSQYGEEVPRNQSSSSIFRNDTRSLVFNFGAVNFARSHQAGEHAVVIAHLAIKRVRKKLKPRGSSAAGVCERGIAQSYQLPRMLYRQR